MSMYRNEKEGNFEIQSNLFGSIDPDFYKSFFGNVSSAHFMGLDNIHWLTTNCGLQEARIEIQPCNPTGPGGLWPEANIMTDLYLWLLKCDLSGPLLTADYAFFKVPSSPFWQVYANVAVIGGE